MRTWFRNLRLRYKIGGVLMLASTFAVLLTSVAGLRVLLVSQDRAVREQVEKSLRVAITLTLRHVQELAQDAVRLAESDDVVGMLDSGEGRSTRGLVEIADTTGKVTARRAVGDVMEDELRAAENSELIQRALRYERYATLEPTRKGVVVRSAAPMLDEGFRLRGAVLLSSPLDAGFAEFLKGAVGANLTFYVGTRPSGSTFVTPDGERLAGFELPPDTRKTLEDGLTRRGRTIVTDRSYEVAVAPLQSVEGERIGLLAVAVDRQEIIESRLDTVRLLFGGSVAGYLLAIVLALGFTRALTEPIGRLRQSTSAMASGDLDQEIPHLGEDEIGELATSFSAMAQALREKMAREARFREELEQTVTARTSELQAAKRGLERANVRLEELATTDGLTGLHNHRHFQERLSGEIERSGRSGLPLSLLLIDVDYFKKYNDEHGHVAGDDVLRTLAGILRDGRRKIDTVARYGGEEFVVVLPDVGKETATKLAEQLRRLAEQRAPVTISLGVATCPVDATDAAALVQAADEAMYAAKHAGRNRVVRYGGSTI